MLKDMLRGRAVLLIQDRTDIVAAAEADGVVLSSRGTQNLPQKVFLGTAHCSLDAQGLLVQAFFCI